ncbi:MAG: 2TM domain-containing protein [Pseudoclavibacter sp.]|nr:2TM domain-containing protein [Pseudoclavibacter sp.]
MTARNDENAMPAGGAERPDADLERRARARVLARNVYWGVLLLWLGASVFMVLLWWMTTPDGYFWPMWPILGMGLGALSWGFSIMARSPFRARRSQVEREMQRMREEEL